MTEGCGGVAIVSVENSEEGMTANVILEKKTTMVTSVIFIIDFPGLSSDRLPDLKFEIVNAKMSILLGRPNAFCSGVLTQ